MLSNRNSTPDKKKAMSPLATTAALGLSGGAIFYAHKRMSLDPGYRAGFYNFLNKAEERSPDRIFRTFGFGDLASSYLPNELFVPSEQLFTKAGGLTSYGQHMQRLLGNNFDVKGASQGLNFTRAGNIRSSYMTLDSDPRISMRFTREGRLSKSSSRYGAPLSKPSYSWSREPNPLSRAWTNFNIYRESQNPRGYTGGVSVSGWAKEAIDKKTGLPIMKELEFQPYLARVEGKRFQNAAQKVGRIGFEMGERGQRLLSSIGLGVPAGTYNKLFHVPLLGKAGQKGLINELMLKRVLPIYLIAGVGLPYLDKLTGHTVSSTALDIYQKAVVAKSVATDKIPGLRKLTDTYENVVPGPQFGPLALPLGGAFAGAVFHYGKVLGGKFATDEARQASWRTFAKEGDETFLRYFNVKSPVAKGLLVGLAAMIPFVPGMIGSRKTAQEQRDIYSGKELVPIRSGRWWDMGSTPWEGGRIKEWRPHWSVLWRTQAAKKSMYESEDNYWSHHPILHPFKFLRDPYYKEKLHYADRPYPVTSPAFSNVPLIGPLLASTIGKWIKPVVRMHEDVPIDDYTLYSSKLEPKGPKVESKFERLMMQELAKSGYAVDTQVAAGKYRLDFVVKSQDGKKQLAIEADGDTYHTAWNANADAERQREIEGMGWKVERVRSTPFFEDSNEAIQPVLERLRALGIKPGEIGNKDIATGLVGLSAPKPKEEFSLKDTAKREAVAFSEFIGLPGFIARSLYDTAYPDRKLGQETFLQGSRQMDSSQRRYYDMELGAVMFMSPTGEGYGYSEPLRRFIQKEGGLAQVNEIPNTMPSWMPGEDYLINFKVGDPFTKVSTSYARLPGAGYEALHPELEGLNPEDYPDISKLEILGDIAPYSREYNTFKGKVAHNDDMETRIRYEKVIDRVRQTRESVLKTDQRRFTEDTTEITGTVKRSGLNSFELEEYPNRVFKLSSIGSTAADLSTLALAENNKRTSAQVGQNVGERLNKLSGLLSDKLSSGTKISLTIPENDLEHALSINAVVKIRGKNLNKEILDQGLGVYRKDLGGAETQAMFGHMSNLLGKYGESVAFTGDENPLNPLRYLPNPANTKLWQSREPIAQYAEQEVSGVRMRRWQRPIHDFLAPYARGFMRRLTGDTIIPEDIQEKRDMNTMADMLQYVRAEFQLASGNDRLTYTNQARRTSVGADQFSETNVLASTLPNRDTNYFLRFVGENDPDKRKSILSIVPEEMSRSLTTQWVKNDSIIAASNGEEVPQIGDGGRLYSEKGLKDYKDSDTKLNYGDYQRTKEIAEFFARRGFNIPEDGTDSTLLSSNIDYEDVKLKVIEEEGYDYHDFNIYDDRAAMLWRKPYIDGAVRELTSGGTKSVEDNRQLLERILLAAKNRNPVVKALGTASTRDRSQLSVDISLDSKDDVLKDMRRNPEKYQ